MEQRATVITADREHILAVWNQTAIIVWLGETQRPAVTGLIEACGRLLAGPGPVTALTIVGPKSPPPVAKAREELARWSRDFVRRMATAAIVAEGNVLRSAAVRGVGTALSTMMPHSVPFKFFSRIEDAVGHLWPHLPKEPGAPGVLREAIAQLRQDHAQTFPDKPSR